MTTEDLVAIKQIERLKAQYCRYFDTRQWDKFFGLFTEDAIFDMSSAGSVAGDEAAPASGDGADLEGYKVGRDAIAAHLAIVTQPIKASVHMVHAPEITLTSPDTAEGIWVLDDRHQFASGPIKSFAGIGHYEDHYVRQDGTWLIQSTRLTRLRVELEPA